MKEALTYDDVLLVPQYSDIESRSEVDITSSIDSSHYLRVPIISSPMDTVTEEKMAFAMSQAGGMGIVHRYNTIENQAKLVSWLKSQAVRSFGAAIGATGDYEERACALWDAGVRYLC